MPRCRLHSLIGAVVALVCGAGHARADEPVPRIGIVVATHVNLSADQAEQISRQLGEAVRSQLIVDIVAGAEAARRLPPDGVENLCLTKPECVVDVASRLNADQLLFLVIVRLGDRVQVDTTWTDKFGQRVASRDAILLAEGADPAEVFRIAATQLLPDVRPRDFATSGSATDTASDPDTGSDTDTVSVTDTVSGADRRWRIHTGTWIGGGVAVAALGGGIYFGIQAKRSESDLERRGCGDTIECPASDIDRMERRALTADILYGTALVSAGVAAFIQYKFGRTDRPAPVTVTGDNSSVGISVGGSF